MNNENTNNNSEFSVFELAQQDSLVFLPQSRAAQAGEAFEWIGDAWDMVKENRLMWALVSLVLFAAALAVSKIPYLPAFKYHLLLFFNAGIIVLCENQCKTDRVNIGLLFVGFVKKFVPLLIFIVMQMLVSLIGIFLSVVVDSGVILMQGGAVDEVLHISLVQYLSEYPLAFFFKTVVLTATNLLNAMMIWFGPALIINRNYKPVAAMVTSMKAVMSNILPGVLFFAAIAGIIFILAFLMGLLVNQELLLILFIILILGGMFLSSTGIAMFILTLALGFMLGSGKELSLALFAISPILYACHYTSYRSLFFARAQAEQTPITQ